MEVKNDCAGSPKILVGIFSGIVFSGKSFFINWLYGLPEYNRGGVCKISSDDVRQRLWGNKNLTEAEQIFKNEVTRHELKTLLVVKKPAIVLLELGLLTRIHQQPLAETIKSAEWYLRKIAEEEQSCPYSIDLRVICFYCDLETVKRRVRYRLEEVRCGDNKTNADIFDFNAYLKNARRAELPVDYNPLYLNTSDESPKALAEQRQEVLEFLSGRSPKPAIMIERSHEIAKILEQARETKTAF